MRYGILALIGFAVTLLSCNNDDNGGIEQVPPRLLSEVSPEDDEIIQEFMRTHFYNYEDFETPPEGFNYRIVIDTIAGANADKRPLIEEDYKTFTVNVSSSFLGLDTGEEDIPHTLYYIEARPGGGANPTVADSTLVRYQGTLLDGTTFDEVQDFLWRELPFQVRGFANGLAQMRAGTPDQIVDNPDGTYSISNSGIGFIIMPSGLAYFNNPQSSVIPRYAPLIFTLELGLFIEDTDNDNDGVPSIEEDLNGNGYLFDDNTDFEQEALGGRLANFRDADDDADGVSTRTEITDDTGEIIIPYPDSDGDGIPDYLDRDSN